MDPGLRRRQKCVSGVVALALGLGFFGLQAPVASAAPLTELESVSSSDVQGNDASGRPAVSANGRWVVFSSYATNLTAGGTNGYGDVFLRDRETGVTQLIDQGASGKGGDDTSGFPQISADGRYIAFVSEADNLLPNVSGYRIYRYDRVTQTLIALPLPTAEAAVDYPSMSADGSEIAFVGFASDRGIIPSGNTHVYVWNAGTGTVSEADVTAGGTQGAGSENDEVTISADGSTVAFRTNSTNLKSGDSTTHTDVVEKNLSSGAVTLVSVGAGTQVNGDSAYPVVDGNGCVVAFTSTATNLVSGDTVSGTKAFDRDVCAGSTEFASITNNGTPVTVDQTNYGSANLGISDNGCLIPYMSAKTTPAPSTGDGAALRDRCNGVTSRLDVTSAGDPSAGGVVTLAISHGSGRYVAFSSSASDLVGNDTNGENDVFLRDTDASNVPPDAELTTTTSGLSVTADASASSDPDGYALSGSISFGDGSTPQTGVHGFHTYAQPGTYGVTVTVTDADGASTSKTSVVTVTAPPAPAPSPGTGSSLGSGSGTGSSGTGGTGSSGASTTPTAAKVKLSGLKLSHARFAVITGKAKLDATHGAKLSLHLNIAATVKLTFARVQSGRRVKGACHLHAPKGARCTAYTTVGTSTHAESAGTRTITLTGVLGRTVLAPGTYRLTVTASAHGHSSTSHIEFTIVKGKSR